MKAKIIMCKAQGWEAITQVFNGQGLLLLATQIVTLSRYTHTFVLFKHKKTWFKLEALMDGIKLSKLSNDTYKNHISSLVQNNFYDLFEKEVLSNKYQKDILKKCDDMITFETNQRTIGKYSFINLLNQLPIKLFNKTFVKITKKQQMICSETVHYFCSGSLESYRIAPVDIVVNDDSYKRIS